MQGVDGREAGLTQSLSRAGQLGAGADLPGRGGAPGCVPGPPPVPGAPLSQRSHSGQDSSGHVLCLPPCPGTPLASCGRFGPTSCLLSAAGPAYKATLRVPADPGPLP